ncbi:FadR/GntR family transcriptional regulator [Paeniglutamicibacter sp. NPDC091659]|uniref:FadR/GntR family transcriptional regulator n=1 Tax=Paeniglutamicibacter sp. NPDC091659 TaxID=3364389 RepID=UPI0037FB1091
MRNESALKPIRQIAAHELVLDQIRRSIEAGQFRPGDRLPTEREMAEQLDVSRTTVRAAVTVLEREGLLTVRRGRGGGFVVQTPQLDPDLARLMMRKNQQEIRDAFDFRSIVESAATGLAATRRTGADVATLRALLQSMEASLQACLADQNAEHTARFQALDSAFHLGIAAAAQNPQLLEAVGHARRQMWAPVGSLFGRVEENANDLHDEILNAIEAKNDVLAAELMETHIRDTRRTIESWLKR